MATAKKTKRKAETKTKTKTKTKTGSGKGKGKGTGNAKTAKTKKADKLPGANPLLRSLRSAIYQVPDLARAKAFYTPALGRAPYFDQPFYVGYQIDGFELGLDPDTSTRKPGSGGVIAYWRVDDIHASLTHLILLGATTVEAPHDVGEHIQIAIAGDPFGNPIGLIQIDN